MSEKNNCVIYYHENGECTKWNLGDSKLNIEPDGDNGEEFILTDEHAWISVGNLSVRINDMGNILKVGVWELGDEFNDPIDQIKVYQPAYLLNEDLELKHPNPQVDE